MTRHRRVLVGVATALVVGPVATVGTGLASGAGDPERPPRPVSVDWHKCPEYSDEVLKAMLPEDRIPAFRRLYERGECGKVTVPLDYSKPDGRTITIAVTRLKATEPGRRLGSLALNGGGPGGAGVLMPFEIALRDPRFNKRYDLIGFDPRGVGYSTKVDCPDLGGPGFPEPGAMTEERARRLYAKTVETNRKCGASDPEFLRNITTKHIAHDLDRVRAALGDRKLSLLGISWGTWLGAVYRSEHPTRAGRMWLDSTAIPDFRLDMFTSERAAATHRDYSRMAAWIARFDDSFGFGTTRRQVEAGLARLARSYDQNPRKFTDLPIVLDGRWIAEMAGQPSIAWPDMAAAMRDLRDVTGTTAPASVKRLFHEGPPPPAGMPEQFNITMHQAAFCNEDLGAQDFETWWKKYRSDLRRYPVTGRLSSPTPQCAGWPLKPQRIEVRRTSSSVVMSGHLYESVSVYKWTPEMWARIGGSVQTVGDDVHGSVMGVEECASKVVDYFDTGRVDPWCNGVPVPTSPDPEKPAPGERATSNLLDQTPALLARLH